jgi:hypothetical protein
MQSPNAEKDSPDAMSFLLTIEIWQNTEDGNHIMIDGTQTPITSLNWWSSNVQFTTEQGDNSTFDIYYTFEWTDCPNYPNLTSAFLIKDASGNPIHAKDIPKKLGVPTGSGSKSDIGATFLSGGTTYYYQLGLILADDESKNK